MNMARPAAPIAAALRVAPSMSMSPSTTSAPAVARAEAIAFPRPVAEPAPVTNATLPTSVTYDILCVVSQSEVFDDLLRDLRGRRPDVHADCRLIRGGFLEIGELAVKQARAHEVAVAPGQPRRDRLLRPGQKNEYQARTSSIDQVSVRTLESRAG